MRCPNEGGLFAGCRLLNTAPVPERGHRGKVRLTLPKTRFAPTGRKSADGQRGIANSNVVTQNETLDRLAIASETPL